MVGLELKYPKKEKTWESVWIFFNYSQLITDLILGAAALM